MEAREPNKEHQTQNRAPWGWWRRTTHATTSATSKQERVNAAERVGFLETYTMWSHHEVDTAARKAGVLAASWKAAHMIFGVLGDNGCEMYPAFQFGQDGMPLPVVREVLSVLPGELVYGGWQLTLWWDTPSGLLGWKRPAELIEIDPTAIVAAAIQEAREWHTGRPGITRVVGHH